MKSKILFFCYAAICLAGVIDCSVSNDRARNIGTSQEPAQMCDMITPVDSTINAPIWFPVQGEPYKYDARWINFCAHYPSVDRFNPDSEDIDFYLDCWVGSYEEDSTLNRQIPEMCMNE